MGIALLFVSKTDYLNSAPHNQNQVMRYLNVYRSIAEERFQ